MLKSRDRRPDDANHLNADVCGGGEARLSAKHAMSARLIPVISAVRDACGWGGDIDDERFPGGRRNEHARRRTSFPQSAPHAHRWTRGLCGLNGRELLDLKQVRVGRLCPARSATGPISHGQPVALMPAVAPTLAQDRPFRRATSTAASSCASAARWAVIASWIAAASIASMCSRRHCARAMFATSARSAISTTSSSTA
jgi:hypothetical protein